MTGENLFKEIRYFGEEAEYARRRLNGQIHAVWPDPDHVNEMVCMQIITSGPDTREPHIRNNYLELFHKAKHHIYIQTPYFIPDDAIFSSLKIAALSGVDVRLMIPASLTIPLCTGLPVPMQGSFWTMGPGFTCMKTASFTPRAL